MTGSSQSTSVFQMTTEQSKVDRSRSHFIKMKQSHCNIKRECGVSYVKKTESKQMNVRDRGYEKLPPIVIQASYTLPKNSNREFDDQKLENGVRKAIDQLLFTYNPNRILIVTVFEAVNEISMKNYLLKPHKRLEIADGKFYLVRQSNPNESILTDLW